MAGVKPPVDHPVSPASEPRFVTELGAVTVNSSGAVRTADVPVPVMVTVYVPNGVLEPTSNVSVEALPAVTVSGLNVAVVPEGRPLTLSATVCGEPVVT